MGGEMRIGELSKIARRRRLDRVLITDPADVRAFTGLNCDSAVVSAGRGEGDVVFYTDFRYAPMVRREAPRLKCLDTARLSLKGRRIGYVASMSHSRYLALHRLAPRAVFVDVARDVAAARAVKTPEEIAGLRAAERLNCEIWAEARAAFRSGMTERDMARVIRRLMIDRGDGEAFDTIVCVGANAAECHHEPDGTVWNGREPVLVDMGVKLGGFCSDMTRNVVPPRQRPLYRGVYKLVLEANLAAIDAARPGVTGRALDKAARDVIAKGGFGRCFGHSLGHGVGYEVHEAPYASKRSADVLKPGMLVTIEPGVYLEGNLGVRIEDLVLITADGCEVLSFSEK
ncbi:MAG: M24 family metallopeptidase [Kiritimatiellae bacterium]|nr:M24 family metallopeptidase [Kiritimatiellia bacterium]